MTNFYKSFLFGFIALSGAILQSCRQYEQEPLAPLKEKTYTQSTGLVLCVNGQQMPSKSVKLSQDGDNGTATLFSEVNLGALGINSVSGNVAGPGVVPGSSETVWNFKMNQADDYWNFTGNGENDYCTYSYAGFADESRLEIFINDLKLKSGGFKPSVWKLAPIKTSKGRYESLPVYIDWQYDAVPGTNIELTPFLQALFTLPVIPVYSNTAYMSIVQALELTFQSVSFNDDSNVILTYRSDAFGAMQTFQTPQNRCQYVMDSSTSGRLFIDPVSFFGTLLELTSGTVPADKAEIIGNGIYPAGDCPPVASVLGKAMDSEIGKALMPAIVKAALPCLSKGFPFSIGKSGEGIDIFIDTDSTVSFLTAAITNLLKDDSSIARIMELAAGNSELRGLLPDLEEAMRLIPVALEKTSVFRIGLSFTPDV